MDKRVEIEPIQQDLFVDWSKPILEVLKPIKKKRKK